MDDVVLPGPLAVPTAVSPPYGCLYDLLQNRAEQHPEVSAILALGRAPLSYGELGRQVDDVRAFLYDAGLGRYDRIALVLPNGPEMAVASLAIASCMMCLPLNPIQGSYEFATYLADLNASALVIDQGLDSPARDTARARGILVFELIPGAETAAGLFTLRRAVPGVGRTSVDTTVDGRVSPADVAFVLQTSGTTSRPKMISLTHDDVCLSAYHTCLAYAFTASDRCLNVLPLFHGYGLISTLVASLMAGASIVCTSGFEVDRFFASMDAFRPTWYPAVPTIHQAVLAAAPQHREIVDRCPLRLIVSAGAALLPPVFAELERVLQTPVIEFYGMTEATSWISTNPLPPGQRKVGSVGRSAGPEVAIMDAAGTVLPTGQMGEVVIRGRHVIQRYDNDPIANETAFTQGWFRTGDEGVLDADGYLFITGRLKEMINRGGEKVTPLEVDDVLLSHPAVAQALTFAVPHPRLGEDVAAVVVLNLDAEVAERDLRQFVFERLAPFKVPQQVLIVDEIPKSPVGKLQRIGMAEKLGLTTSSPESLRSVRSGGDAFPQTPVEVALADLWATLLGHRRMDRHDDFFRLGGDSIVAAQLISRIRETWGVEWSVQHVFETSTVADMAARIANAAEASISTPTPPLLPLPRGHARPLSHAQQRLWFIDQLGTSQHAYHLLEAARLLGDLDVGALQRCLTEITRRHEILRTTFTEIEGEMVQVVGPVMDVPLPIVDLQALPSHQREAQIQKLAQEDLRQAFDLTLGPLFRARLLRLQAEEHVLLLPIHHIVFDDWSHGVLWRELAILYQAFVQGDASPLPELSIQYADAAHWQRQIVEEVGVQQLDYWQGQLAGAVPQEIVADHLRPPVRMFRGARHPVVLSASLTEELKRLSQQHQVTLFMTLLAAVMAVLHRYTGQSDILVGSLISNRNRVELENLIGFWINTIVLRTDLSGNPRFDELLRRVRATTTDAYRHSDLPFEKLLESLGPERDLSRNPFFQVLFVLHNLPDRRPEIPGLALCPLEVDSGTARFDITLDLWESPEGLRGWLEYDTELLEATTIRRLDGHWQTLLEGVVQAPQQRLAGLPLLNASERQKLYTGGQGTVVAISHDGCVHRYFEHQALRIPDAMALIEVDRHLTYGELNRRANQVAHYLRVQGVSAGECVGLYVSRSIDMVVGLLGILKADAAYVPLDPAYPAARLALMGTDARLSVVLTQAELWTEVPASMRELKAICLDADWPRIASQVTSNPVSQATSAYWATVLYTSGSTGQPKGVPSAHGALINVLAWLGRAFPFRPYDMACHKTAISFIDAVQELLAPLVHGIPVVIVPDAILRDPAEFIRLLARYRVTRILLVPTLLRLLLDTHATLHHVLPHLDLWFAGGEALSGELVKRFHEVLPGRRLVNLYGATENAADVTWYETAPRGGGRGQIPIGRPIDNMQTYLLGAGQALSPTGQGGELHVAGIGLTQGYLHHPAETAKQFVPDALSLVPGARLYRTGDRVRYGPDGHLAYLGRLDQQMKVRGHRVEPEEIERGLEQHPSVQRAVVVGQDEPPGDPHLVAYLVPSPGHAPSPAELRRFLQPILPDYMQPSVYTTLDALPLTPTGKVHRRALPAPAHIQPQWEGAYLAPRSVTEELIAGIWASLFNRARIGVHDDFFDLGGHSLLAIRAMSRLRNTTGVEVPAPSAL